MTEKKIQVRDVSELNVSQDLKEQIRINSEKCIRCKLCQKECAFLRKYGKPKDIADSYDPSDKVHQGMPFECSLCQLCAVVCPIKINPALMFLDMRRETVKRGHGDYPEHSLILEYEKRGTSKKYTYYSLPTGCDTIFFPGCTFAGTRPDKVKKIFEHLKKTVPSLGIVLDCCTKPSHDLGRDNYFHAFFDEMREFLVKNSVRNVVVACPSCHEVFKKYGNELSVRTAYEFMAVNGLPESGKVSGTISIQDSCAVRYEETIHSAIRDLVSRKGLSVEEMPHSGTKTLCCGEGGSVGFISQNLAKNWGLLRKKESEGKRLVAYCAGCANFLNSITPTSHIIDLLFEPEAAMSGKAKVSKAPFTYLNRLKLKEYFRKQRDDGIKRERTLTIGGEDKKGGMMKRVILLLLVTAAIFAIHYTGAARYLEQNALRELIQGYGVLAPFIYMLVYTIAPAIFLPGLPITIVGGILFGPFWGVVYTITSATAGACLAFLVSRYIARDWVENKLRSPRWRRLDKGVERHGWKIVAFTRLIPLFPFNLLNYAFGLTKIKFFHYAVTTFICMLPACIAFVVFSSSLLDLLKGQVSPAFVIGLGLVILVSLIPLFYYRYKTQKGLTDPL